MNGNDARTVRLFTAQVDGTVEDNTTGSPSPPGLTSAFHYNVRLVSENFQVTSFGQSNPVLLV